VLLFVRFVASTTLSPCDDVSSSTMFVVAAISPLQTGRLKFEVVLVLQYGERPTARFDDRAREAYMDE
jgi:hypothetical protein